MIELLAVVLTHREVRFVVVGGFAAAVKERPVARKSLARLFAESPLKGLNLAFERDPDQGRPVKL